MRIRSQKGDFGFGMGFVTIGGMLLALVPLETQIARYYSAPVGSFDALLVGGVIFCAFGVISILLVIVRRLVAIEGLVKQGLDYLREKRSDPQFDPAPAMEDQLAAVFEFSREMFGEEISEEVKGKMKSWHRKNPEFLWIINKIERKGDCTYSRIVGYFSIFPLTKKAYKLVDRGELFGSNIRDEDMTGTNSRAAAVYIGGIAAKTRRAQSFTLAVLLLQLHKLLRNGVPVYARPVTDDGRRLVKKYGFVPVQVSDESETWRVVHKLAKPSVAKLVEPKLERLQARAIVKEAIAPALAVSDSNSGSVPAAEQLSHH